MRDETSDLILFIPCIRVKRVRQSESFSFGEPSPLIRQSRTLRLREELKRTKSSVAAASFEESPRYCCEGRIQFTERNLNRDRARR
jgi:hypothetical protein